MKALVTGASGFLGSHLVRTLKKMGWDVTALDSKIANLLNPNALHPFSNTKFDKIFHLAVWTEAGDFCLYHAGEQWVINQQINTTVLNWWYKDQPQAKLISIGTSCAYEEGEELSEENYLVGAPVSSLYTYGMTKRMLLIGQQALNQQFGLNYLTVIPSTLYGSDYHLHKQMHFIFDLGRKILRHKHFGDPIILWGDGYQKRELVYVDDFIQTLLKVDAIVNNDLVNIGAGVSYTIRHFAETICELVDVDASLIQYDTSKYVGAKTKQLSNSKLDRILPDRKNISLELGLKKMLDWLESKMLEKLEVA